MIILNLLILLSSVFLVALTDLGDSFLDFWLGIAAFFIGQILLILYIFGSNLSKLGGVESIVFLIAIVFFEFWIILLTRKQLYLKEILNKFKINQWLVALLIFLSIFFCFSSRVSEFSGDGLMYQLPVVASWNQNNNIYSPVILPNYWRNNIWSFYPQNVNLIYLWSLKSFSTASYFKIVHFLFLFFGIIVLFYFNNDEKIEYPLLAPVCLLASPVVFSIIQTGMIDLEFSCFYFFSILSAFLYLKNKDKKYLLILALYSGILLGIKLNAIVFYFFLAVSLAFILFFQKIKKHREPVIIFTHWFFYIAVQILFGFIFYFCWAFRNIFNGHNMLYPLQLLGSFKETFLSNFSIWHRFFHLDDTYIMASGMPVYNYDAGFGIIFSSIGIISLFFAICKEVSRKKVEYFVFLLPTVLILCFLFYEKRPIYLLSRYLIFIVFIAAAFTPYFVSHLKLNKKTFVFIISLLLLYNFFLIIPAIFNYTNVSFDKDDFLAVFSKYFDRYLNRGDLMLQNYKEQWSFMNSLTEKNPANVLAVHQIFTYDLYGSRLQNNVFFDYATTQEDFFNLIKKNNISYIFLSKFNSADKGSVSVDGNVFKILTNNVNTDELIVDIPINTAAREAELNYEILDGENGEYFLAINDFEKKYSLNEGASNIKILSDNQNIRNIRLLILDRPSNKVNIADVGIKINSLKINEEKVEIRGKTSEFPLAYFIINKFPDVFKLIHNKGEVYVYEVVRK